MISLVSYVSGPFFLCEKYFKMLTAELFNQQANCKGTVCMNCQTLLFRGKKIEEMSDLVFV